MGKRTLYSLESDIRRILEGNDFISTSDEGGKQWYMNLVTDLANFVQREIEKAREEGIMEALGEVNKTLGTNFAYINGEYKVVFRKLPKLNK